MSKRHNILLTIASFFMSSAEKIGGLRNLKLSFSSNCFIAGNSHIKIISLHTAVFSKNASLYFGDDVHLLTLSNKITAKLL